jgi:hypothetical protein|tara:strand:- start:3353 stop:3565 length:213 start_codon:yes stop_codon:yes gene_type:complete
MEYKPVTDYNNNKRNVICHNQSGYNNNQILNRLERDISALHADIKTIKDDISIIKQYIIQKKAREDKAWF